MRKLKLDELNRLTIPDFKSLDKIPVVVVLDNLRSGMNVGSFFRTADAFKIDRIFLCGITQSPPHKEILKTAIGASKTVKWEYHQDVSAAISILKNDHQIIGIEQTTESVPLRKFLVDANTQYALVFGNEVNGLSDEILSSIDHAVEIQQFGTKHSLNVSVCGGVVMHHFTKAYL